VIDLRSDTLTKPTPEMLAAMTSAELGDEQYREDPTVNELQRRMAELLGQEAALFVPTATMANQIALRAQTTPGSTLLAEERTHVMVYEMGGPAIHSGLVMQARPGEAGRLTPEQIADEPELGRGGIVVLENTHRSSGGRVWPLDEFRAAVDAAHERGAKLHLDGARLFNASVAAGVAPSEWARHADSVTICFSKGLCCPLGAVVAGSEAMIEGKAWES
jgi:threonine aldolase